MKRFFQILAVSLGALWVAASLLPPKPPKDDVDLVRFGKIPVQVGGRVKPLDTVARNSLLIIHTKQTLRLLTADSSVRLNGWPTRLRAPVSTNILFGIQTPICSVCLAGNRTSKIFQLRRADAVPDQIKNKVGKRRS
jgi:hypothetical protein